MYARHYTAQMPNARMAHLLFDGIDTIQEIVLNGQRVLHCKYMFIRPPRSSFLITRALCMNSLFMLTALGAAFPVRSLPVP